MKNRKIISEEVRNSDILGRLSHEINESIDRGESPQKVERKFDAFDSYIMNNSIDFNEDCYKKINKKVEEYLNQK